MADHGFTVKQQMVVTNEKTKRSVLVDHVIVDGIPFFKFVKKSLATLLGGRIGHQNFPGVTVFQYLQDKRNSAVTNLIKQAIVAADHFRDVSDDEIEIDLTSGIKRAEAFAKHGIGDIVELAIPGFESNKAKHDGVTLKLLATPKVAASIWMEAVPANFAWLRDACSYNWTSASDEKANGSPAAKRKLSFDGIEAMTTKKVKVKCNDGKRCILFVNYKAASGKWNRKQARVDRDAYTSESACHEAIARAIEKLEMWYDAEHHHDGSDDEDAADDDVDDDADESEPEPGSAAANE